MTMRLSGNSDNSTLVLVGDKAALRDLALLLRAAQPTTAELKPMPARAPLAPLSRVIIDVAPHDVLVTLAGDAATLAGDAAELVRLAHEVDLFLEHNDIDAPGMHMHLIDTPTSDKNSAGGVSFYEVVIAGPVPDEAESADARRDTSD